MSFIIGNVIVFKLHVNYTNATPSIDQDNHGRECDVFQKMRFKRYKRDI